MPIIKHDEAPLFTADGTTVTGYAAPSRGAADTSVWRVELAAGSASPLHSLTREEVFMALDGRAVATIDGVQHAVGPGDCLNVPAGSAFAIAAAGDAPFRALTCMPAGGKATVLPDGPTFVPPWAA